MSEPTVAALRAALDAARTKLESWAVRRRELVGLREIAEKAEKLQAVEIIRLTDEQRAIRMGPRDDLFIDMFGMPHDGISQERMYRYEQLGAEIARREAAREAWLNEPVALRWTHDRMGRLQRWSLRRPSDVERMQLHCDRATMHVEHEVGVAERALAAAEALVTA